MEGLGLGVELGLGWLRLSHLVPQRIVQCEPECSLDDFPMTCKVRTAPLHVLLTGITRTGLSQEVAARLSELRFDKIESREHAARNELLEAPELIG